MHRIIRSYLNTFVKEYELSEVPENTQFEYFFNYCQLSRFYPESFDVADITTSGDDDSIDGAAVLIGEALVLTAEEAEQIFEETATRSLSVRYLFFQAKRSEGFDSGEMSKFALGVERVLCNDDYSPTEQLLVEIKKIHDLVVNNLNRIQHGRPLCSLYYASTGRWDGDNKLQTVLEQCRRRLDDSGFFHSVEFTPIDRDRLIHLWNQTKQPATAILSVDGFLPISEGDSTHESYLIIARASDFVESVISDEDGRIKSVVFEHNVRAYLGDDNPVNTEIRRTLQDAALHERFALLNNGLTIVAPDVRVQAKKISFSNYQIVNGCQTSHVLYRNSNLLTPSVRVAIKVIKAEDPSLLEHVVEATNSQSNVASSQFISIRPFARKLEAYFNSFDSSSEEVDRRLYFERRTRQYADADNIGKRRIFDIENLARAYSAMFLDVPHLACRYPKRVLRGLGGKLYVENHREHAYYVAALAQYRLSLALSNNYVPPEFSKYKWHLLMIVKYRICGKKLPGLSSKRLDSSCERIVDALKMGGKASAKPFLEATSVIKAAGEASMDRLKRQAYTNELRSQLGVGDAG